MWIAPPFCGLAPSRHARADIWAMGGRCARPARAMLAAMTEQKDGTVPHPTIEEQSDGLTEHWCRRSERREGHVDGPLERKAEQRVTVSDFRQLKVGRDSSGGTARLQEREHDWKSDIPIPALSVRRLSREPWLLARPLRATPPPRPRHETAADESERPDPAGRSCGEIG